MPFILGGLASPAGLSLIGGAVVAEIAAGAAVPCSGLAYTEIS